MHILLNYVKICAKNKTKFFKKMFIFLVNYCVLIILFFKDIFTKQEVLSTQEPTLRNDRFYNIVEISAIYCVLYSCIHDGLFMRILLSRLEISLFAIKNSVQIFSAKHVSSI